MEKKLLIDAAHPEETRVVVAQSAQTHDFDFESNEKTQITGNIYLAKVTRVEPSLQAAFLDYGGNRHGFLAFSEIHPDYYQIPLADKEALLAEQLEVAQSIREKEMTVINAQEADNATTVKAPSLEGSVELSSRDELNSNYNSTIDNEDKNNSSEILEEDPFTEKRPFQRKYKIQEVIKVRQILLVQVIKEERGNKGAALTTYLSIAGRYCVLMPNTSRGGGISKKITLLKDRIKLKKIIDDLDLKPNSGLIIRTAGGNRTKTEIKRDYEFLLKAWESIREQTLSSIAPALIHAEGNLIKRAIRDLYDRDIKEIIIEGDAAYKEAKAYLKLLMPSHAKYVKKYDGKVPIFSFYEVENYLQEMFNPIVQLKSGGYIVIGITEALVAIDVNSGKATKERSIEETALKTNLEAASEIARQLKLRDLAGLIVIDFIDMEERKNNVAVEKKIRDCISLDRARIQIGRISSFGLLEMSRQRLRPGMLESTTTPCLFCHGTGSTRSDESLALQILRDLDKEGSAIKMKDTLVVKAPVQTANFLINKKREHMLVIENRYQIRVELHAETNLISPNYLIEKPFNDKRRKKITDNNKAKAKNKDKENKKEIHEGKQDLKASTNLVNAGSKDDVEEQKNRKKKRKRRYKKDPETPAQNSKKMNDSLSSAHSVKEELSSSLGNENQANSIINGDIDQKEVIGSETTLKKDKTTKIRTRASAKKTIEGLKNDENKPLENGENSKDSKMGKKGWWDR
tara:strand:+ start:1378 stop:3606 length:2229 start_codon:yes stop_codon:yes gene_type:complete